MIQTHYERSMQTPARTRAQVERLVQTLGQKMPLEDTPFALLFLGETLDAHKFTYALRYVMRQISDSCADPYSYHQLCADPRYCRIYSRMSEMGDRRMVEPSMMVEFYALAFERAGRRCYDVHPDLGERLRDTELRGLNAQDLRLPYEAVYLMVPESAGLKVWNRDTGWHKVEGIYIVEDRHARDGEYIGKPEGPEYRAWRLMVCGESKGMIECGNERVPDDAISYFQIPLIDGMSLDECIQKANQGLQASMQRGSLWDEKVADGWRDQFRWAMNVMLYCTWEEPGEHWEQNREARQLWERIQKMPGNSKKRGALQAKLQGLDRQPRLRLGYKIRVKRGEQEQASVERSGAFGGSTIKTRVAGHWKRQACGPKLVERKLIWIEPYWRNLDGEVRAEEPIHAVQ